MRPRNRSSPDRRPSPSRRSRMSQHSQMSPQSVSNSPPFGHSPPRRLRKGSRNKAHEADEEAPTPICRCRVLYLGSAVPHVTKDGLQGIQEPLKELYPEDGALGAKGIDSWLSVWSNGFLLENVDENRKKVTRFFPVESLHYCAAVRYVLVPLTSAETVQRFLPLDSPFARNPNLNHPPLFAAILRRTSGIKVLECHVFICKRETAANALVRCAFHAYADSTYAKRLESGQSLYGTIGAPTPVPATSPSDPTKEYQQSVIEVSEDSINSIEKVEEWKVLGNGQPAPAAGSSGQQKRIANGTPSPRENGNGGSPEDISVVNGDDNHKVWAGKTPEPPEGLYGDYGSTMRSFRSSASGLSHRNRPRQMMMPSSPPPPPIPEELQSTSKEDSPGKKEKSSKKKKRSKSREHSTTDGGGMMLNGDVPRGDFRGSSSVLNGPTPLRAAGRKQSVGSLLGAAQAHGPPPPPPQMRMNGHGPSRGAPFPGMPPPHLMMGTLPPNSKKAGTFSARGKKGRGMPHPFLMYPPHPHYAAIPPHLMPPPGHPLYGMPMGGRPGAGAVEEPIYMPNNARPMSPVASYQPGHFPHEAYYNQQQYATIDKSNKYRKNKKANGKTSGSSKHPSSDSNADDSEFGAGIYKKGHINERAFSYSIRNEHRSRSFGSLANLQFAPNGEAVMMPMGGPNGPHVPNGEPMNGGAGGIEVDGPGNPGMEMENGMPNGAKGRDYAHMMADMDLGEDTIERSEVPPGLYQPHPMYGPPYAGGPPPQMVMMPPPGKAGKKSKR